MRAAAVRNKPRIAKVQSFPAPIGGWVKNVNLASADARLPNGQRVNGAHVLENWFPTATGIRMRGGTEIYAQLSTPDDITSMFTYVNGNNQSMFCATATAIYNISGSVFDPLLTGFTGGNWSSVQFATTGGVFLDLVNGKDDKLIYDGATFYPINDQPLNALNFDAQTANFTAGATLTGGTSGAHAPIVKVIDNGTTGTLWLGSVTGGSFQDNEIITGGGGSATADGTVSILFGAFTGVPTSSLSHNWVYKNRLFYVEKNSLNAWYLPVDSITGAATKLPLGGVFTLGGSLLFGATWSVETGNGLNEQCAFFTTEGEVAVYQGNDPSSAANWIKVGTYRIGKPRGPKAFIRAGGDLVIATDIGFIPLSVAVHRDIAALSPNAISYMIETAWNDAVAERVGMDWNCAVWPTKQMVVVALPTGSGQQPQMLVANARTGAWCLFTGLDATCLCLFGDRFFFGSKGGLVVEMEVTGADLGAPYTAAVIPLFDSLKTPAALKTGMLARSSVRATSKVTVKLSLQTDFNINLPTPPDDTAIAAANAWGGGIWGVSTWGVGAQKQTFRDWQSVSGSGYAVSVAAQITSGSDSRPDVEYIETELTFDMGDVAS